MKKITILVAVIFGAVGLAIGQYKTGRQCVWHKRKKMLCDENV